jgi:hypothetical protein
MILCGIMGLDYAFLTDGDCSSTEDKYKVETRTGAHNLPERGEFRESPTDREKQNSIDNRKCGFLYQYGLPRDPLFKQDNTSAALQTIYDLLLYINLTFPSLIKTRTWAEWAVKKILTISMSSSSVTVSEKDPDTTIYDLYAEIVKTRK